VDSNSDLSGKNGESYTLKFNADGDDEGTGDSYDDKMQEDSGKEIIAQFSDHLESLYTQVSYGRNLSSKAFKHRYYAMSDASIWPLPFSHRPAA
jgi:hypothetical protein